MDPKLIKELAGTKPEIYEHLPKWAQETVLQARARYQQLQVDGKY